jgi:hypothetical protein
VLLAFWINTPDPFPMVHPGPDELFCKTCDCRQTPPRFDHSWRFQRQDVASILHDSILDIQCQHVYAAQAVASAMVAHSVKSPNESFAWDVAGLQRGLPTSFIFTKTSPAGKTGAERPGYMQRHIDAMRASRWSVNARGHWFDGVPAKARQSVWIVVEDGLTLDPGITATLDASDLNWVYLGYGPTHSYGNAQHNAALALIHTLASRVVKDGPILGIDDDAEIHPDLLQLIWKVKKAGIWPIGNLVCSQAPHCAPLMLRAGSEWMGGSGSGCGWQDRRMERFEHGPLKGPLQRTRADFALVPHLSHRQQRLHFPLQPSGIQSAPRTGLLAHGSQVSCFL